MTYPTLFLPIGFTWEYEKDAKFTTTQQVPQSGRGPISATLQDSTIWGLELVWSYLKVNGVTTVNDFAYLKNFYEAMRGSFGRFLFDPSVNNLEPLTLSQDITTLENGFSGIGDGVTTVFPLWRSSAVLGGSTTTKLERVQNVTILAGVYLNNTLVADYTLSQFPATVTFTTAPPSGQVISWAGSYSYLVHFAEDTLTLNEFMANLWELKSLKLESINL